MVSRRLVPQKSPAATAPLRARPREAKTINGCRFLLINQHSQSARLRGAPATASDRQPPVPAAKSGDTPERQPHRPAAKSWLVAMTRKGPTSILKLVMAVDHRPRSINLPTPAAAQRRHPRRRLERVAMIGAADLGILDSPSERQQATRPSDFSRRVAVVTTP